MSTDPTTPDEATASDGSNEPGVADTRGAGPGGVRGLLDMSRRRFLATGSVGVAAAGMAAAVPGLPSLLSGAEADAPAVSGAAASAAGAAPVVEGEAAGVSQQLVAHVSDVSSGEMRFFYGNQTFSVTNPQLARSLAQAVKAAGG